MLRRRIASNVAMGRFYRVMLRKARYCHGKLSVRPSVCDVDDLWSYRFNYFENNYTMVRLGFSLSACIKLSQSVQREHLDISGGIGVGYGKCDSRRRKPAISMKRGKIEGKLLLTAHLKSHTICRLVKNETLKEL